MISQFSLTELAKQYGGDCIGSDKTFSSVSIDTRTLAPGELFVAIKGQRFDAHDYLDKAIEKGAKGLVIEVCSRAKLSNEVIAAHELAVWLVEDGVKALGDIARYQRQLFAKPIIAVTGSSGKTTVKGMLRSIFAAFVGEHSTFATRGNFNNHIGVPLSLMQLNKNHQYAVIEMGASGPNEIDYLSSITRPSVALVNNVMPAHVEGFGSIDGIAKAKGEIYEGLGEAGVAVVNADDVYANQWLLQNKHRRIIVFSVADGAKSLPESIDVFLKVSAKNIQALTNGCYSFCLSCGSSSIVVKLNVLGRHNIANALAASACGLAAGIQLEFIAKGLALFAGEPGRLQLVQSQSGCTLIDDTYNANPGSVNAASDVLSALAGEKILVLGDMAELGDEAKHFHQQVGHYARDKGINAVFAIGNHCRETVTAFGDNAHFFSSMDRLIEDLLAVVTPDTAVMVKGSRSSKMERVIQALKSNGDNNNASLAC